MAVREYVAATGGIVTGARSHQPLEPGSGIRETDVGSSGGACVAHHSPNSHSPRAQTKNATTHTRSVVVTRETPVNSVPNHVITAIAVAVTPRKPSTETEGISIIEAPSIG